MIKKKDLENAEAIENDKAEFKEYALKWNFEEQDINDFLIEAYENLRSFQDNLNTLRLFI